MKPSRVYLQRLHMAAFGRFFDAAVGPFSPGLNVVYGKNETGKTTVNAFIRGVLFGWEDARGQRNVYKPDIARRSGTLFFADAKTGETYEVSRTRNVDGASFVPADAARLLETVDKDTFSTMFALTSDELRGLDGATDMTSKLLTAESGAAASPAEVMAEIDKAIASYTSRAASARHSLVNLGAEEEECKRRLADARTRSDALKKEYREYTELLDGRAKASDELSRLNSRIEKLATDRAEIGRAQRSVEENRARIAEYDARSAVADAAHMPEGAPEAFDEESEARAFALVERLRDEHERLSRRIDAARSAFAAARADAKSAEEASMRHPKASGAEIALVCLCVALAIAGAAGFVFAVLKGDFPLAAAGAVLAAVGIVCVVRCSAPLRSRGSDSALQVRKDALDRARGVLDACEEDELMFSLRASEELEAAGLGRAQGSISLARSLVEEAREGRLRAAADERMAREAAEQRSRLAESVEREQARKEQLLKQYGIAPDQGSDALAQMEGSLRMRRDRCIESMRASDARLGELKQLLREGSLSNEFDVLKTQQEQIETRKREAAAELAELLLARRALEKTIELWKSESVPAAHRRASELLSLMTGGAWQAIEATEGGAIVAVDAGCLRMEPRFLSTGTCQQLYLALRIALLECASDVGAGLPVLADDILVNFDDERRIGAVKALAELARTRQVILFTCHKEILDTVNRYAADCTMVAL